MLRVSAARDAFDQSIPGSFQQSDTINVYAMTASTAQYPTVPVGANLVKIGFNSAAGDLWLLLGATSGLTIPSSNNTAGTAPEVLSAGNGPYLIQLKGATSLGIVTSGTGLVTLAYFS